MITRLRRFWHRIRPSGHHWIHRSAGKRKCDCGAEEWLFGTPYPAPGEPAYQWRDMTLDQRKLPKKPARYKEGD